MTRSRNSIRNRTSSISLSPSLTGDSRPSNQPKAEKQYFQPDFVSQSLGSNLTSLLYNRMEDRFDQKIRNAFNQSTISDPILGHSDFTPMGHLNKKMSSILAQANEVTPARCNLAFGQQQQSDHPNFLLKNGLNLTIVSENKSIPLACQRSGNMSFQLTP